MWSLSETDCKTNVKVTTRVWVKPKPNNTVEELFHIALTEVRDPIVLFHILKMYFD